MAPARLAKDGRNRSNDTSLMLEWRCFFPLGGGFIQADVATGEEHEGTLSAMAAGRSAQPACSTCRPAAPPHSGARAMLTAHPGSHCSSGVATSGLLSSHNRRGNAPRTSWNRLRRPLEGVRSHPTDCEQSRIRWAVRKLSARQSRGTAGSGDDLATRLEEQLDVLRGEDRIRRTSTGREPA
jgi:hypothetical protein